MEPQLRFLAVDPRPYEEKDKRIRIEVRHFIGYAAFSTVSYTHLDVYKRQA